MNQLVTTCLPSWNVLLTISMALTAAATATEPRTVLELPSKPGNPRNSEGDFIQLKDGSVLFVYTRFTGGGSDHDKADLVSRLSTDRGATWSSEDRMVIKNESNWNVMSVSLLRLADSRIALFYLRKNSLTDCRPVVRFSDDEAKSWSDPVPMIPDSEVGYYVLNNDRVVQLESGRLVAPLALHHRPGWDSPDWAGTILCCLSDDGGNTWRRSRSSLKTVDADGKRVTTQEPGVVPLKDGRLLLWSRTNRGEQYRSVSSDGGETWSSLEPMGVASPLSPASIERIPSTGDLLMVWNNHAQLPVRSRRARTPFTLAVSRDEGKSWENINNLDADPQGWFCYTAIEVLQNHVLLGHVAGRQAPGKRLARTRITRVPMGLIYAGLKDEPTQHDGEPARIVSVKKIWDRAKHNAFTDLLRFKERWYCVFREGESHVSPHGKLRVIVSDDGEKWRSASLIERPGSDLRDAKLSVTPSGELMLTGAAALQQNGKTIGHQSLTWFSKDGNMWSPAHPVADRDVWLWRVTWNARDKTAYGLGYGASSNKGRVRLRLYHSKDGRSFDTLVPELLPNDTYPNESSILFRADGAAHCLLRRDGVEKSALLGSARPPYRDWEWADLGIRIGGPDMIELPDGRTVAAVRLYKKAGARTALCWLDPDAGTLKEFLSLPSGGDNSYAGLVWHDNHLWISYYSGHEASGSHAKTAIYLAKVAIPLQ